MPQLLIELFSEEIPARMQKRGEEDLAKALKDKLAGAGLAWEGVSTFSSPRRLGAVIEGLPAKAADVNEEKKGPRVGAPDQAVQGFLKSAGLSSIDQAEVVADKKGDFYLARIARAGRATPEIAQTIIPEIIRAFPWPKSMRSGSSDLQWVRPLHNILCLFDGAAVRIEVEGVGNEPATWGHRFHAPGKIIPKDAGEHYASLRAAQVLIDREERKNLILENARRLCAARKLELVEDAGLLEEVTGLVEWPVVLMGAMDPDFLDLPGEVIRLTMRTHQKYFAVRDPKSGKLAPNFITVANISAKDGGDAIAAGNSRVLSARLNDARFFWDGDRKTALYTEERRAKLEKIVFHQKLGSVWAKVERVRALAKELCAVTGADAALVDEAARNCKMDLVTETVGEFPELQGQIGRQLYLISPPREGRGQGVGRASEVAESAAENTARRGAPRPLTPSPQGEGESVAAAIEDHYRPLGPNDRVPSDKVAVTLALADKLDTLVGFWAIDEKPTGSSDPFALRRAALGAIRSIIENNIRVPLGETIVRPIVREGMGRRFKHGSKAFWDAYDAAVGSPVELKRAVAGHALKLELKGELAGEALSTMRDLLAFLADRLKVQLRDAGKRHDLVDAVFAPNPVTQEVDDDLVRILARVEALDQFLRTEDGANLLAGYKRAANILRAEEKKEAGLSESLTGGAVNPDLLEEAAEKALHAALESAAPAARAAVEKENFADAMKALAALRAPVDRFFEEVLVNAEKPMLRRNRLLLLSRIRDALSAVADFSKIEG